MLEKGSVVYLKFTFTWGPVFRLAALCLQARVHPGSGGPKAPTLVPRQLSPCLSPSCLPQMLRSPHRAPPTCHGLWLLGWQPGQCASRGLSLGVPPSAPPSALLGAEVPGVTPGFLPDRVSCAWTSVTWGEMGRPAHSLVLRALTRPLSYSPRCTGPGVGGQPSGDT